MKIYSFQEIVLAENADYRLSSNPSGTVLYQEHFRINKPDRAALKKLLQILSSGRFEAFVIKVNNGNVLPPDDLAWVEKFNLQRLFRAGISNVAYVSPQNIFNSLEMEKKIQPESIFRIKIFKKIEDAVQWLEATLQQNLNLPEKTSKSTAF